MPEHRHYTELGLVNTKDMFARAGATDIRRLDIELPNDAGIIAGTV